MSPENAMQAVKDILERRHGEAKVTVLVDNPGDCRMTIQAFKKLGCKVKVEADGTRLIVSRPTP